MLQLAIVRLGELAHDGSLCVCVCDQQFISQAVLRTHNGLGLRWLDRTGNELFQTHCWAVIILQSFLHSKETLLDEIILRLQLVVVPVLGLQVGVHHSRLSSQP